MGLELRKVHEYATIPGTNESKIIRTTPYLRLKAEDAPPLFVQSGRVYAEGGDLIADLPPWFWAEARKASPAARQQVGLHLPEEGNVPEAKGLLLLHQDEPEPEVLLEDPLPERTPQFPVSEEWTCPECGESVGPRQKGLHIARHRRAAKRLGG